MSDRTGMALGRVRPIMYFENASGHLMLAPESESAHHYWKEFTDREGRTLFSRGYDLREADTLRAVQKLQDRLVEQEERVNAAELRKHQRGREMLRKRVASDLYSKLASSSTSQYEKEFIKLWLELRDDEKRDKYRQALEQRNMYLWAAEMDSGHDSSITDRIKV